jgi:hypothetical protein
MRRREGLIESAGRVGRQVILRDADALGIGIMDIDELAHALGVIFCRAPLGDLDLAPRLMHVEDDEEIDGAIAVILVIVAFELTRFGRDRLAHLADELDRALVEQSTGRLGSGASARGRGHLPCGRRIHHRRGECTTCPDATV